MSMPPAAPLLEDSPAAPGEEDTAIAAARVVRMVKVDRGSGGALQGAQDGGEGEEDFGFLDGLAAVIGGAAIHGIQPLSGGGRAGDDDDGSRIVAGGHSPDSVGSQLAGAAEDGVGGLGGGDHGVLMGFQHASQVGEGLAGEIDQ